MSRKMIGIGAPTTTGGRVLEGNSGISIDGSFETSSIGHLASCPACSAGKGPIVAVGPRTVSLPAGPVALEGDYVACGCPSQSNKVLSSQSTVYGGAESKTAPFQPIAPPYNQTKSINKIYMSYGQEQIPVSSASRFYTDISIHIKTSGYAAGETVSATIIEPISRTLTGTVGDDGVATIPLFLEQETLDMEGSI